MTTKKTTAKTAAKKTVKKAKATAKSAKATVEAAADDAENQVESILKRIQDGFKEAGAALAESGAIMDDKRREVLVTLIENAQENTDATFAALREVMEARSLADSLKIQREALRDGLDRNVAQMRDLASLTAASTRESVEPVSEYISSLRTRAKHEANA